MLEEFSQSSIRSLIQSNEEAQLTAQPKIRDIELFLAVTSEANGIACSVLSSLGLTKNETRSCCAELFPQETKSTDRDREYDRNFWHALERARHTQVLLDHRLLTTGHLLIGSLDCVNICKVVEKLGLDRATISEQVKVAFSDPDNVAREERNPDSELLSSLSKRLGSKGTILLTIAESEARKYGHFYIDSGHLLLACFLSTVRMPPEQCRSQLVDPVRKELLRMAGTGSGCELALHPLMITILEDAISLAKSADKEVDAEFVFQAIKGNEKGIALRAMENLGIEL
ncbi:MAG: hypothetical protein K2Y22_07450 [Candidatus Obscuribacterales bacterium]|nr:hypothetical protein [Candidatus Obscuribacterales bacterium]